VHLQRAALEAHGLGVLRHARGHGVVPAAEDQRLVELLLARVDLAERCAQHGQPAHPALPLARDASGREQAVAGWGRLRHAIPL
jgi:hypothetical protein